MQKIKGGSNYMPPPPALQQKQNYNYHKYTMLFITASNALLSSYKTLLPTIPICQLTIPGT